MPTEPEFENPSGFGAPQGTEPGGEFEAVAVLRLKPDGNLCLVSLDGSKFEDKEKDYDDEEESTEEVEVEETVTEAPAGPDLGFANRIMQS
jgi:hypothetical protein